MKVPPKPGVGTCSVCGEACLHCRRRLASWEKNSANPFAHFWRNTEVCGHDECWPWHGHITPSGYGKSYWYNQGRPAHVISLATRGIELREGQVARHTCDHRWCVNPWHIIPGTPLDNVHDAIERNRFPRGDNHWARRDPQKAARVLEPTMYPAIGRVKAQQVKMLLSLGDLTHREIAEQIGVGTSTVSRIKRGVSYADIQP